MATSSVVKNFTDGTLTIKDATGTPISCTVRFSNGDLKIDGLKAKLRETVAYQSRGAISSVRHTARKMISGSFSCMMSEFSSASANDVLDAFLKTGAFASGVSKLGASAEVWAVDMVIAVEGTNHGDSGDHTITIGSCEGEVSFAEGDPNSITIAFTSYGTVSGDLTLT
jgi:hypothetical protein